ncbi:MAG: helix-turn-helix transcriptional regulator [Pseudobutyrivibrio sp.]|nr:helix-turn-helix transcriptional regulator [Pseudobutyrivibrio sp.]
MAKTKRQIEYRYYDMPQDLYGFVLTGEEWERNYKPDIEGLLHFHNFMEIGVCHWGDGKVTIDYEDYKYRGQEITIVPENIPHSTVSTTDDTICKWDWLYLDINTFIRNEMQFRRHLPEDIIKRVNSRGLFIQASSNKTIANLIKGIIYEYDTKGRYFREGANGYIKAFVVELLRLQEQMAEVNSLDEKKYNDYIKNAVDYIKMNYDRELKMAEIADVCGLSESHFRRIFEEGMNMKPNDYLNMIRINKACELIQNQNYSMEEVGYRVGYETPSTFMRNFKKLTGMTPYQWKKKEAKLDEATITYKISAKRGW